jgi:CheY-like chemotaxis protein
MNPARIVLVDDNTADVNLLRMALEQQHAEYDLAVMETGDEALRFVQQHRESARDSQPCVILLDLHLPKYDGLAILRAIRQAPSLAHIHVVVLSGMASPAERDKIATLGAAYRQKPFDLNDYLELGAEVMAICASVSAAAA